MGNARYKGFTNSHGAQSLGTAISFVPRGCAATFYKMSKTFVRAW